MTFDELQNKIGKQELNDWYQHKNGGGWVNKKAQIYNNPYIGSDAIVFDGEIHGGLIHGGRIRGGVIYSGEIYSGEIFNGIIYSGVIYCGVIRGGEIHGGKIHGGIIYGGIWKKSPLQIQGSRNFINTSNNNSITIGCITNTIDEWLLEYKKIGKDNNYTLEQIEEYYNYILLCKKYLENL